MAYMAQIGVQPNTATFNSLIDACGRANKIDHAFALFEHMQSLGVPANAATFSTLISVCATSGELDRALVVLQHMSAAHIMPEASTYAALILACGRVQRLDCAFELFGLMGQCQMRPSPVTYKAIIEVCCRCTDLSNAEAFVAQMQSDGFVLDGTTCNALASAFCKNGQYHKVVALVRTMCQMRVPATTTLLQTLSVAYTGDQRPLEEALTDLQRTVGQPTRADGSH